MTEPGRCASALVSTQWWRGLRNKPRQHLVYLSVPWSRRCSIGARPAMSMMGGAHGGGLIGL